MAVGGKIRGAREKTGATVLAVHLPRGKRDEALILAFRPPRIALLIPVSKPTPEPVALAVAGMSAGRPTVLFEKREGEDLVPHREALSRMLPRAEVLAFDAKATLKFLWFFRDSQDPLTLGHASERELTDEFYAGRRPPSIRDARGRTERTSAYLELKELVTTLGWAIGVRPPIPRAAPSPGGWGLTRLAGLIDACAGLYAGLLHRWRAPLAVLGESDGEELPLLRLADRRLLDRSP